MEIETPIARRTRLDKVRRILATQGRLMVGQIAVEKGFLCPEELDELLRSQRQESPQTRIGALLLEKGMVTHTQMVELLHEQRRRNLLRLIEEEGAAVPNEVLEALGDPERQVDGYVLVHPIGKGGTGSVWKAWDQQLHRWVAIKMLRGDRGAELKRFIREARAAARLCHPNIIRVHKVSEREGHPFLVMDYCDGGSMEGWVLEPLEAARLLASVARAMEFTHRHGVIHRDLKPANLLLDGAGNVYISDFGIASLLPSGGGETTSATDGLLGTPAYIAPEQALGRGDARSDVYSLGATLYRLVVGEPPFQGSTPAEVMAKALRDTLVPPRHLRRDVPRDLERIILKCMRRDPRRRYSSAEELANDLERFQQGKPVFAQPKPAILRLASLLARAGKDVRVGATTLWATFWKRGRGESPSIPQPPA